ncbi:MAG: LysR family transcriptional regulator [Pseudomonadota bacterium]
MDVTDFNIRHLRVFTLVHDFQSFTRAAEAMHLTQPAVSQVISRLERLLACKLIDRAGGHVQATAYGTALAARARNALQSLVDDRVTMAQIRALRALANAGTYASAASQLGLSAPSLHRCVRELGLSTGKAIVTKRGRGVVISDDGRKILRGFSLALAELGAGLSELKALDGREIGRITIGAMPLSRARVLPCAVATFHREHRDFEIAVTEGSYGELIEPMRDGDLDILVGAMRYTITDDDIIQTPLFEDQPAVFARAGHPLAGRSNVTIAQLADHAWVMPQRPTPLRMRWEAMFHKAGLALPQVPVASGSVLFIREVLRQSELLTVLSPHQVVTERQAGMLVPINGPAMQINRNIGLMHRRNWQPTPLQKRFLENLKTAAQADIAEQ